MEIKLSSAFPQTVTPALERAARALCYINGEHPNMRMGGHPAWMHYLPEVQAVLEAVREPTGAMSGAGATQIKCGQAVDQSDLEQAWRAMIDAALEER